MNKKKQSIKWLLATSLFFSFGFLQAGSECILDVNSDGVGDGVAGATAGSSVEGMACGESAVVTNSSFFSTALGFQSNASGNGSTAVGHTALATQSFSAALGKGAKATGVAATAIGYGALAPSTSSTALGHNAIASSEWSIALGEEAHTSSGQAAMALGYSANATGSSSMALGFTAEAAGHISVAIGGKSLIDQPSRGGVAIGYHAQVKNAPGGIAIGGDLNNDFAGFGAKALAEGAIAIGADVVNSVPHSMKIGVPLRIERGDGTAGLLVHETSPTVAVRNVIQLKNNGPVGFSMEDTNLDNAWDFRTGSNGSFLVSNIGTPGSKLQINRNGSLFIDGGGFSYNSFYKRVNVQGTVTAVQHISSSSRAVKKDFAKVDSKDILNKIKGLEVTEWRYKDKAAEGRHIGPMAEDFYSLFKLGADNKHVSATDMASVAIIAAKELKAENESLKKRLDRLERLMKEALLER